MPCFGIQPDAKTILMQSREQLLRRIASLREQLDASPPGTVAHRAAQVALEDRRQQYSVVMGALAGKVRHEVRLEHAAKFAAGYHRAPAAVETRRSVDTDAIVARARAMAGGWQPRVSSLRLSRKRIAKAAKMEKRLNKLARKIDRRKEKKERKRGFHMIGPRV
jgi:hypothetical protein